MKQEKDYIRDIAEIRSMMERSSKFVSLSGWAGIMAGIFALSGAYIASRVFDFNPEQVVDRGASGELQQVIFLAVAVLILALSAAVYFSFRRARKRGEQIWNATGRQMMISMAVPFITGSLLVLILISNGLIGLVAPFSLLFYGLALFNASKFTYNAVRVLGLIEIALGLLGCYFVEYGLLFWAVGFGVAHIIYGIYVYYRYEQ